MSSQKNALLNPPFANDPPVKLNVNAKTLGLVLTVLGVIGILLQLLGLIAIFGLCSGYAFGGCGLPIIWLLGDLVGFAGIIGWIYRRMTNRFYGSLSRLRKQSVYSYVLFAYFLGGRFALVDIRYI